MSDASDYCVQGSGLSSFDFTSTILSSQLYDGSLPTTGLSFHYSSRQRLYIYVSILAAIVVGALARGVVTMFVTVNASAKLHNQMYDSVSNAPILFFDTNPSGRILNRFSKVWHCEDCML